MKNKKITKILFTLFLIGMFFNQNSFSIEEKAKKIEQNKDVKKTKKEIKQEEIKLNLEEKNNKKVLKLFTSKKARVKEVKLPQIIQGKPKIPFEQMPTMSIEQCVEYAINHNPNLFKAKNKVEAVNTGAYQYRANYAPSLFAKVNYNHNSSNATQSHFTKDNSIGFNVGISEMIWDFGRTTAKINMAKYNTKSAQYDYDYEILRVIYEVKINYYKVLSALANLDIYEQYERIQRLNYERTKAMFDEGLKSKIDVVNAKVNMTDAQIQLVEGRNKLETSIIDLQNSMFYQEDTPFVVKNTENFNFLKANYRKKIESITNIKPQATGFKKTPDGLIMLTSGIEHNDIIQNFQFKPLTISKKEAVNQALEFRPDLKSTQMLTLVQKESLSAIKKQYTPEINGELSWGYTRSEGAYSSPLKAGASIGIGSVNPYLIHYQIKEGENYLDIALHNLNIAKTDIFWEVQTNYVNMRQLERTIPLMNSKVRATLENFELADGRYSVGLNNYIELQNALLNYNTSQLNFVDTVFQYNVARETLLKSMGIK